MSCHFGILCGIIEKVELSNILFTHGRLRHTFRTRYINIPNLNQICHAELKYSPEIEKLKFNIVILSLGV